MKKGELITIVSCVFLLVAGVVGFKIAAGKGGKEAETSAAVEPAVSADEEELAGLRDENAELKDKMEKLERAVERLTAAPKKPQESPASKDANEAKPVADSPEPAVEKETNPVEQLLKTWEAEGAAFSNRDNIKGAIPPGYYIYLKDKTGGSLGYVSQRDAGNNRIAETDFFAFGYVKILPELTVQIGNGVIVKTDAVFSEYPTALKLYCAYIGVEDWNYTGMYQIGRDIPPGRYVVKSLPNDDATIYRWNNIPGSEKYDSLDFVKGAKEYNFRKGEFVSVWEGYLHKQ